MNKTNFSDLSLSKEMLHNLNEIGYKQMTSVQASTLPHILEGSDVIAQAKTGSGKTAAFGIGLLAKLQVKKYRVQTLVLCPTRELADQVAKELRALARFTHNIKILTLCGGVAFRPQEESLRHEAHIIVGTPGRVLKHLDKNTLNLKDVDTLVFDEADRMLDMGFIDDIEKVLTYTPKNRQTLLFSATYTDEIIAISDKVQSNAISVKTTDIEVANKVTEVFYEVKIASKLKTLINVLGTYQPENVIIFTNTKVEANELAQSLKNHNIDTLATHGDLEQYERNDVLVQFANKSCRVLIATDVAARGLDIKELAMVINYDIPYNEETYTHRIGRTARAGEEGVAISIYNSNRSFKALNYQNETRRYEDSSALETTPDFAMKPIYKTLVIEAGKKDKLRAGDILGALTGDVGIAGKAIGKIDIYDKQSYVAIDRALINSVHKKLSNGKIKGRKFPVWILK
ncbi:ATP-dependent RNA helicase DbpA [Francisella adeliensis]|uniref:ATP-dependent RNA helicase DbpA n=1 Tax=Francisella adeliensis TaxID=2007306 RepID=A0A2Z4XX54_9GAMM|nr:ATP-dependent RNA helicase DbpA [Francisella adeliensis]AXA33178.1 ATP-dependent RNA helicase DbpA [Francisella adeliensis]MBK2085103.1 ATP-dependent RNA helicase DbpA [Francisella adeliensis]MBK2096906.1 ATP-dependent RNA helicase DbpA [Francisella adeliensis]QIW11406.1 ATP-dependent RNA helicase DbpA [Francisella adeliensis]QIW13281.1 ATP-dependent RNA helicase DbpA [Francisella adeliensis]